MPQNSQGLLSLFAPKDDLPIAHRGRRRPVLSLPRPRLALAFCTLLVLLYWLTTRHRPISRVKDWVPWPSVLTSATSYPLSFDQIREYERRLPQHDASLAPPEGRNGRYLKFSNEVWGLGLNNQLNNRLVMSHVAFSSNRSYVFQDIMFNETWEDAKWFPLNTFISGPTAGGAFPPSLGNVPRSVSKDYWEKICPHTRRVRLNVDIVNTELHLSDESDGVVVLGRWAEKLRRMPDNCVEITYDSKHIIDYYFFGSQRSLTLFPLFSGSPVVADFRWSDIVLNTVERNIPLITHSHAPGATPITHFSPPGTTRSKTGTIVPKIPSPAKQGSLTHVLALHVRRGDYGTHCENMAQYSAGYNSWNLLPSLPDKYVHGGDRDEFMRHCWPNVADIVNRARVIQEEHAGAGLNAVYILTNAKRDWIEEVKEALLESGMGWERVTSSRDLMYVGLAEKLANQAADMEIARRAGVFVGNGFSTMTANIVLFRLVHGIAAQTTRFW